MAAGPNFLGYLNTFEFSWLNGRAILTIAGASSYSSLSDLPGHVPGRANLILCTAETCSLVDDLTGVSEWTLSRPTTEYYVEATHNLPLSLAHTESWRQIEATIDSIRSLPVSIATSCKQLIFMKICDFVNGWPAMSALFAICVTTNLLTEDYLAIVADRLPSDLSIMSPNDALARYIGVHEFRDNGEDVSCAICLDQLRFGEIVGRMPCFHTFHWECIARWLSQRSNCPICQYQLPRHCKFTAPFAFQSACFIRLFLGFLLM